MDNMLDEELVNEYKARLADRYTAAELCELLDLDVNDIIETYWDYLLMFHPYILEEVGLNTDDIELE